MSAITFQVQCIRFKIGWRMLLILSILGTIGHAALLFAIPGDELLFLAWATFPLYAAMVLFIPYLRGENWAWYVTWVLIVPFALVIVFNSEQGPLYLSGAILMALAQLLTRGFFFSNRIRKAA